MRGDLVVLGRDKAIGWPKRLGRGLRGALCVLGLALVAAPLAVWHTGALFYRRQYFRLIWQLEPRAEHGLYVRWRAHGRLLVFNHYRCRILPWEEVEEFAQELRAVPRFHATHTTRLGVAAAPFRTRISSNEVVLLAEALELHLASRMRGPLATTAPRATP
jgi:hypothetical protein